MTRTCSSCEIFDAIVIGTGFAGAVTAARLVEAGQRICVLERGRRYQGDDFPIYPDSKALLNVDGGQRQPGEAPDLARWFWGVDQGLYDIRDLDDVIAVQAAAYGGGSLIYANVHLRAPKEVFEQGWPSAYRDGKLDPYYDRVACMLDVQPIKPPGAQPLAKTTRLREFAAASHLAGIVQAITPPLAVNFAKDGLAGDDAPRPNRFGRKQGACDMRGHCWLGCRKQAKNSLDLNYLAIVEDAMLDGQPLADIRTLAEVETVEPAVDCAGGANGPRYVVHYRDHLISATNATRDGATTRSSCFARNVFLCAGAVGTTEILMRSEKLFGSYPTSSAETRKRLGSRFHPNADSIAAVFEAERPHRADYGPTITSALLYQSDQRPDRDDRVLWTIDVKPHPTFRDEAELKSGVTILCGGNELRLVQPPMFDFGGFDQGAGVALVVVEGGDQIQPVLGRKLEVQPASGAGEAPGCRVGDSKPIAFANALSEARRLEDWFLIQDGGYPTDVEPALGILRSPLWLGRNRFRHGGPIKSDAAGRPSVATGAKSGADGAARPTTTRRADRIIASETTHFPLATALDAFFGLPKRGPRPAFGEDGPRSRDELPLSGLQPLQLTLERVLPPWLLEALADGREALAQTLAPLVGLMLDSVLNDVVSRLVDRFDLDDLDKRFDGLFGDIPEPAKVTLIRGLLRQGIDALWGSEVALAEEINRVLITNLPTDAESLTRLLTQLIGWVLQYREGDGHTGVLLTMGRDQYRGRILRDPASGRLIARLPVPLATSSRVTQEQVLRDIAQLWQGELRTNPAWISFRRRITVHSQGGCPMHENEAMQVTKDDGQVVGCDGLYVMDAAAFPTAVGVNPSATIAAVAEKKIEMFIEKLGATPAVHFAPAKPLTKKDVDDWLSQLPAEFMLDPLGRIAKRSTPPKSRPPGLTFQETMSGFISKIGEDQTKNPIESEVDWRTIAALDRARPAFAVAERLGIEQRCSISTTLTATIDDLDRFLRMQRRGAIDKVPLTGTVTIIDHQTPKCYQVAPGSWLQFFGFIPSSTTDIRTPRARNFRYHIELTCEDGKCSPCRLEGAKIVRDDLRFDLWQDLATLYTDIFDGVDDGKLLYRGILRLNPLDFFEQQLRSITIEPSDIDPTRRAWAYAAFVRYYLAELAGIYLSRTDLIKDLIKNVVDPVHDA